MGHDVGHGMSMMFGSSWFQGLFAALCTIAALCWMAFPTLSVIIKRSDRRDKNLNLDKKIKKKAKRKKKITGLNCNITNAHSGIESDTSAKFAIESDTSASCAIERESCGSGIPLSPGEYLSKLDLLRALHCSMAVYKDDNAEAENVLKGAQSEYPSTTFQFQEVHMSRLDHPEKLKFLVAYAPDAIFLAIRGSHTQGDWASNFKITRKPLGHGGRVHTGFYNLSEELLKDPYGRRILDGLIQTGKKIILCGHSMGGAVSHMTLLRYMLQKNIKHTPKSLFSIGFGAPHICDRTMACEINNDESLRWRFINIVNMGDPVPRSLHHPSNTLWSSIGGLPTFLESDTTLLTLSSIFGLCLEGRCVQAFQTFLRWGVAKVAMMPCRWLHIPLRNQGTAESTISSPYHQFGRYVFLTREEPRRPGGKRKWKHVIVSGQNTESTRLLQYLQLKGSSGREEMDDHKLLNYKSSLISTGLLDNPAPPTNRSSLKTNLIVSTPLPQILSGRLQLVGPQTHELRIKGRNLLFVTGMKVDGGHQNWEILEQTDIEMVWISKLTPVAAASRRGRAVRTIEMKTAFGLGTGFIEEVFPKSASLFTSQIMIRQLVQTLLVAANPGEILNQLDNIIRAECCSMFPQKLSGALSAAIKTRVEEPGTDVTNVIDSANKMIENVLLFLESPGKREDGKQFWDILCLVAHKAFFALYHGVVSSWRAARFACDLAAITTVILLMVFPIREEILTAFPIREEILAAFPVSRALLMEFRESGALGPLTTFPVITSFAAGLGVFLATTVITFLNGVYKGFIEQWETYWVSETSKPLTEMLPIMILEASRWNESGRTDSTHMSNVQAVLELELVRQVEASGDRFKEMIEHSHCTEQKCLRCNYLYYTEDLQFKSKAFKTATSDSARNLLRRMSIVVKTHALYKQVGPKEEIVGLCGAVPGMWERHQACADEWEFRHCYIYDTLKEEETCASLKTEETDIQVPGTPLKTKETDAQVVGTPLKTEETDIQVVSTPLKIEEIDTQLLLTPLKTEETDAQVASIPLRRKRLMPRLRVPL